MLLTFKKQLYVVDVSSNLYYSATIWGFLIYFLVYDRRHFLMSLEWTVHLGFFSTTNSTNILQKEENKEHPRVVVSRSHPGKVTEIATAAFGPKTTVSSAAGAGFKVMEVVNGTYDVYLHATAIKKWDLCAGDAIIKTVHGKMTTIKGEPIDYSVDSDVKITGGIVVTRFDHEYYLDKLPPVLDGVH